MNESITRFNVRRTFGVEFEMVLSFTKIRRWVEANATSQVAEQFQGRIDLQSIASAIVFAETGVPIQTRSRYTHDGAENAVWKFKYDGSLRCGTYRNEAVELVSPVLVGAKGLAQVQAVLKSISKLATVNASCGFHVHHSVEDFARHGADFKNVYKVYREAQLVINGLVAPSRRSNNYCAEMRRHEDAYGDGGEFYMNIIATDRYQAVNFSSVRIRNTVEFRQHQGTVNWKKAIAWIVLTQRIVEKARTARVCRASKVRDLAQLLKQTGLKKTSWGKHSASGLVVKRPDAVLSFAATVLKAQFVKLAR